MKGLVKKIVQDGKSVYPVTVAEAVFVEDDKTLSQKLEELRNGIKGGATGTYVIELERFGITEGSQGKPPYTLDQYEIGLNNCIGFNNALKWANHNGFGTVMLPRGRYSICYTNFSAIADNYFRNNHIALFSNQILDLNGSTIDVMFDSNNKSPYDLSPVSNEPWRLNGRVFVIEECHNAHIRNGTIIGDIANRSFTSTGPGFESEKGMEQTYGVFFDRSSYCSAEFIDSSMFMGDGICIGASPKGWPKTNLVINNTCLPGFVGTDGVIVTTTPGAYVSDAYAIDPTKYSIIQMRTGGGYTRIPKMSDKQFFFVFFDAAGALIIKKPAVYLQPITVPYKATTFRIQFLNEDIGLPTLTTVNFNVGPPQCNHIKISHCQIHDNHRGGVSGGSDYTLIEYCNFYRNGEDSGIGVPLFPDTTRYAINFEDSYANYLMIYNNEFSNGFNGVLLGVYHARVVSNYFANISGVVVYNNSNTFISQNMFYSASVGLMPTSEKQPRNITVSENTFNQPTNGPTFDLTSHPTTRIKFTNNTVYCASGSFIGNIELENNYFRSFYGPKHTSHTTFTLSASKMIGNTFEGFDAGAGYSHRVAVNKRPFSNQLFKDNLYIRCYFGSTSVDNHTEFTDSQFFSCEWSSPPKDPSKSSSVTFNNCELTDTSVNVGVSYTNNVTYGGLTVKAIFNNCKINLTEAFTKVMFSAVLENKNSPELIAAGIEVRKYECVMNNTIFDNQITSKNTYMFKYTIVSAVDTDSNKTVKLKGCTFVLADATKFSLLVQNYPTNLAIVDDTEYVGFTAFTAPTGDKLRTSYKQSYVKSSAAPILNKETTCWFDTTVNKAYWWTGTAWVDAMGVAHP